MLDLLHVVAVALALLVPIGATRGSALLALRDGGAAMVGGRARASNAVAQAGVRVGHALRTGVVEAASRELVLSAKDWLKGPWPRWRQTQDGR